MRKIDTSLPGVCVLEPRVFEDARGYFYESWREDVLQGLGLPTRFVQDNQSMSGRGVLRGLHYQRTNSQAKLIRVLRGEIFDVAVDIRPGSPNYGKWAGERLSAENRKQMFIPEGFAHGFLVLSDQAECLYKCTNLYTPAEERGILWNDPAVGILWPLNGMTPQINARDAAYPVLAKVPREDLPSPA